MYLSNHLTLAEATKSATAIRKGIHNLPPDQHLAALVNIANKKRYALKEVGSQGV